MLKSWVNQNVKNNLKLIKQENYLKIFWQKAHNINENLTKQENTDIFTKSLLLEAPSIENIYQETKKQSESAIWYQQRLGCMTASNFYRISAKTQSLQNNISNNAESLLKNLTEINTCESKATKHGTAVKSHVKITSNTNT